MRCPPLSLTPSRSPSLCISLNPSLSNARPSAADYDTIDALDMQPFIQPDGVPIHSTCPHSLNHLFTRCLLFVNQRCVSPPPMLSSRASASSTSFPAYFPIGPPGKVLSPRLARGRQPRHRRRLQRRPANLFSSW